LILETQRRQAGRAWRMTRAMWRNARVIGREFRVPIGVFLVAIFGGGWLYGELLVRAGYARLPFLDLPYSMLALMLFQAPTDLPRETELILFWYLMPLIAAYVAGRGVFEFINLFYRSDRRHTTWEEAVASTYRDHVIVLGVGHLGTRVIRALVQMGFDVVAIDLKPDDEKNAELAELNVPQVLGDGRLSNTLEKASIRQARALIVCTSNDHMNLEVTMRARDLNPNLRIVVRVWDDQFAAQIRRFMNVEAVLSATDLAAPSFAGSALGIEITQTLTIHDEDYSLIRLHVAPGSFLDGKQIDRLQDEEDMDIVLHGHSGNVQVHPAGDAVIRAGDTLVIFALHRKITDVVARNQRSARSHE
jgi:Trk K+ transport system NAD-binding subunit